jgi:hypothetical protein
MGFFCFTSHKLNDEANENKENMKETKFKNTKLKIHICGLWKEEENEIVYKKIKDNIKEEIDLDINDKDRDFIEYESTLLTPEICQQIEQNIEQDKIGQLKIANHAMLCFGDDNNMDMVLKKFSYIHRPRIILITKKEIKINEEGKKYITIIIRKGMSTEELKDFIIKSLDGIYRYYNEQNDNKDLDDYNFPLKILLTGMRLSGKSTFVNLFFNKLLAFTSNDLEIGTLKTSEYDIKNNDNQNIIKLIDTPGINSKKRIKEKTLNEINKYIKEKKIDFILFFYNEGNFLEEGKSLLKLLDKSETPVFIIINKSRKADDSDINEDIQTKIIYLKSIDCQRLSKKKYFIEVNLKSNSIGQFFGMESIFDKIEKIVKNKIKKDNKINEIKSEETNNEKMLKIINDCKNKKDWDKDEGEIKRK